jgi:hypothetical protein
VAYDSPSVPRTAKLDGHSKSEECGTARIAI